MMKKTVSLLLVLLIILILEPSLVDAHTKEGTDGHDQGLSTVLFGNGQYKNHLSKSSKEFIALSAIENGIAICLDQFDDHYKEELKQLKEYGVHNLPESIDDISFDGNQYHRMYTHKGWNHYYTPDKGKWEIRKTLLLQTVNKVFGFSAKAGIWNDYWIFFTYDYGYTEQCDAFAAFLYYLHILQDYDSEFGISYNTMIHFAMSNPTDKAPDIVSELERILPIIFETQKDSNLLVGLLSDIHQQGLIARSFEKGNVVKEHYEEYQKCAEKVLGLLEKTIPGLLKKEPFFARVFYSEIEAAA